MYFENIIKLYINKKDHKTQKTYIIKKRNINYIIKNFINNINKNHKYFFKSKSKDLTNKIFICLYDILIILYLQ